MGLTGNTLSANQTGSGWAERPLLVSRFTQPSGLGAYICYILLYDGMYILYLYYIYLYLVLPSPLEPLGMCYIFFDVVEATEVMILHAVDPARTWGLSKTRD